MLTLDCFFFSSLCHSQVRSQAACCVADLLRMFAPTCPYSDAQLKVVFGLFLDQLANLAQPAHPDYSRYFFLLEMFAQCKLTCVLCNKGNDEDAIIQQVFELLFALAKVKRKRETGKRCS